MSVEQLDIVNNLDFDYDEHAWCIAVGWQMGGLEAIFKNTNFDDDEMNAMLAKAQTNIVSEIKPILEVKGFTLHDEFSSYQDMSLTLARDLALKSGQLFSFYMIGIASFRLTMASDSSDYKEIMIEIAKSCINSIPSQYLKDKELFFNELLKQKCDKVVSITDFLTQLRRTKAARDQLNFGEAETERRRRHLRALIAQHRENSDELEMQKAKFGIDSPLYLINALKDVSHEIEQLERELERLK